jgi:hypothetical protein
VKTITLAVLVSFLVLLGLAVADQTGAQRDSSMRGMMQEMMKGEKSGDGSMEEMNGMGGMMRMMKMMNQCSAMMEDSREAKEG